MTQVFSHKLNATNTNDFLDKIKDTAVSAGWTLHDDLSSGSPYGYVLSSTGEDADQMTCYLYMFNNTDKVSFQLAMYWNNTTHTDTFLIGHATYSRTVTDDDASFDCFVSANKSSIVAASYVTEWNIVSVGILQPFVMEAEGTLDTAASSGSNVDLSLGSGEAVGFQAGKSYQIVDQNSRQWVTVNAVNTATDTITVATLSYNFAIGAVIGSFPYRWFLYNTDYNYFYILRYSVNGTGDETTQCGGTWAMVSSAQTDPNDRAGGSDRYGMLPGIIYDSTALAGMVGDNYCYGNLDLNITSHEHTLSVWEYVESTSTGSNTSTTLNDTGESWTTNEWAGKVLIITAGTGAGQFRLITSNTATELTVPTWSVTPDATSDYVICEEGWLYFYFNNAVAQAGGILAYKATA